MMTLDDVLEVVKEQHPYAWTWQEDVLRNWVAFYAANGLIICVSKDGKNIDGLVMWRLVMKPEDGVNHDLAYDPEGKCCFIDFTYGPSAEIRRGLIVAVIKQIGRRELVAWERHGTLRVYKGSHFVMKNLKGERYGETKSA